MSAVDLTLLVTFTVIVASLIWARIFYFKVQSKVSKIISYINDPAAFVQMGSFYYYLYRSQSYEFDWRLAELLFMIGLGLFYWAVFTAKSLSFASGANSGDLITSGPYSLVRHPCYLSYILFWFGNCLLFATTLLWVSFLALLCVYVYSASNEESNILRSDLGAEYSTYKSRVGMFLPKLPS